MNQIQTEVIFLNLLRHADEFVFARLGTNPTPDAGSFRARVVSLYHTFQADKPAFVASSVQLGFLATLLKEYAAFRLSPIEQIGTPEILIGQIRWEDIYDKPDILAASSDWADITNKPDTFTPATHGHAYSEITDKPATFTPATHGHAYSEITDKPATFTPTTHGHAYADITDRPATYPGKIELIAYIGNGESSKVLALSGAFLPVAGIISNLNSGNGLVCWNGVHFSNLTSSAITIDGVMNLSGSNYRLILWG